MHDQTPGSARIRRVALGGLTAFAIYMASAGVTACSQLLIARIVGAQTYGVYAYVIAWMTILAYFSTLGFDTALLRFVAAYQTMREWSLARGIIQYAERRALAVRTLKMAAVSSGPMVTRNITIAEAANSRALRIAQAQTPLRAGAGLPPRPFMVRLGVDHPM